MSYAILALLAIGLPITVDYFFIHSGALSTITTLKTIAVLCLLTLIFDNLIVGFGIVQYESSKILGIYLGYIPIEDLSYAIAAGYIAAMAVGYSKKHAQNS